MVVSASTSGGEAAAREVADGGPAAGAFHAPRKHGSLRLQWWIVALGLCVAVGLWNLRGDVSRPGAVVSAAITLITSDRDNLSCAVDHLVGPYRCEFASPNKPWPGTLPRNELLAPYVTMDRQVLLVPGL